MKTLRVYLPLFVILLVGLGIVTYFRTGKIGLWPVAARTAFDADLKKQQIRERTLEEQIVELRKKLAMTMGGLNQDDVKLKLDELDQELRAVRDRIADLKRYQEESRQK